MGGFGAPTKASSDIWASPQGFVDLCCCHPISDPAPQYPQHNSLLPQPNRICILEAIFERENGISEREAFLFVSFFFEKMKWPKSGEFKKTTMGVTRSWRLLSFVSLFNTRFFNDKNQSFEPLIPTSCS